MKKDQYLTKALAKILSNQPPSKTLSLLGQILTDKELDYVERRLRIGLMLKRGNPYTKIQDELKVSAATVAVVADQMKQAGFLDLINKLEKETKRFQWIMSQLKK
jgi:uncharacterized protein YerC